MSTDEKSPHVQSRQPSMTPQEFRQARRALKLTPHEMGLMLGYDGENVRSQILKMEQSSSGGRTIRPAVARLMRAYLSGYRPPDWPTDTQEPAEDVNGGTK